jgi:predicted HicB family RNase H-like nuclease
MPTPLRNLRVPDDLWRAAQEKAEREGTTVTAVLVAALTRYVKRG